MSHRTPSITAYLQHKHKQAQPKNDDEQWKGDPITQPDEKSVRIMFHNIHGLHLNNSDKTIDFLSTEQVATNIDLLGVSETNLDTTNFRVLQCLQRVLARTFPGISTMQFDASPAAAQSSYKPGGTGIISVGKMTSRLDANGKGGDPLGRWSFMHFRRKKMPPLTVISAYQVCTTPTNAIGNTAWHQQKRALLAQGRDEHPRKAFIDDLAAVIRKFQVQKHDIILGGDFNETTDDPTSGVLRLATTVQLTDPWDQRYPAHPSFHTHRYGSKRIDSILVSHRLLPAINSIGYAPFDYLIDSDHRAVVISFDIIKLFGDDVDLLSPSSFRGVRTSDKVSCKTYIEKMYTHLAQNNAFELRRQLDDNSGSPDLAETLDRLVGQGGDSADKACRRRRPEFYSQHLVKQRAIVGAYRSYVRGLSQGINRRQIIAARLARKGIQISFPLTSAAAATQYKEALTTLQTARKEHETSRRSELSTAIATATNSADKTATKALKCIDRAERTRATYKILEAIKRRNGTTQQLDRLEVPASWPPPFATITDALSLEDPKICTEWVLITEPSEIEYYLLLRNQRHFGQAQGTPFTIPPLSHDFDWGASTPAADALLAGEYTSTLDTPQCQAVLRACKVAAELDTIPAEITYDEFKGKIQNWRETTSTSPSGRHLGRYRSLFARHIFNPTLAEEEHEQFQGKQRAIAELILSIINYAIRNEYVLTRWKTIVNTMIFKDIGVFKIHRLRIIHIYEADFNLFLAIKWRQLLRTADDANLINPGQYGGRPGCEAQSLALLERRTQNRHCIYFTSQSPQL